MADVLNYFDVERGLGLQELAHIIPVAGAPGTSGDSTTVPKGSLALDYNSTPAALYYKHTTGSGTDKWVKVAGVDDLGNISWREPVVAHDSVTTTVPTNLDDTVTVDGVTVNDGDRVLLSAISGGDGPNVYTFQAESSVGAGDGTYIETSNEESAGDRVYVIGGTNYGGDDWAYNNAGDWVLVQQSSDVNELGYIRQFIGKTAAGDLSASEPNYSSVNHISDLDDLVAAIGKLDAQLGAELVGGNIFAAGDTIAAALEKIDDELGALGSNDAHLSSVSGAQTLDTVEVDGCAMVQWLVTARDGTNIRTWRVVATHDGSAVAGASNTDRAVSDRLKIGTLSASIAGVSLTGTHPNQTLDLDVTSTGSVDWHAVRECVPYS